MDRPLRLISSNPLDALARTVEALLVVASQPLTLDELAEATADDVENRDVIRAKVAEHRNCLRQDVDKFLQRCGYLSDPVQHLDRKPAEEAAQLEAVIIEREQGLDAEVFIVVVRVHRQGGEKSPVEREIGAHFWQ